MECHMGASLALQNAVRRALIASPIVTSLVPASSIVDRNGPPQAFPCIILGEAHEADVGLTLERDFIHAILSLHIWSRDAGTTTAKAIAIAVKRAIGVSLELENYHLVELHAPASQFWRDPDGMSAHSVVTIEALLQELTA